MDLLAAVLLSLILALSVVLAAFLFLSRVAKNELEKSDCVKIRENYVEIFASYDNLEYYIWCALFAFSDPSSYIVVYLSRSEKYFEENLAIAKSFERKYKNIRLELI